MASRSDMVPVGTTAPDFEAVSSEGTRISLSALRGQPVVLVFYPADNTPLCTAQLCALRDAWSDFTAHHACVFGVNPARQEKHVQFVARNHFPFPIIVDAGGEIAALYGCRALFGLIRRTVYGIDASGSVVFAQRGNPSPAEIMRALP